MLDDTPGGSHLPPRLAGARVRRSGGRWLDETVDYCSATGTHREGGLYYAEAVRLEGVEGRLSLDPRRGETSGPRLRRRIDGRSHAAGNFEGSKI